MEKQKWKDIVTDETEQRVFKELADPKYDFRTVQGIARTSRLTTVEVEFVIDKYPDLIRRSPVPDKQGNELFTLKEKPESATETYPAIDNTDSG